MRTITLYFDGGCWPNPGGKAIGSWRILNSEGQVLQEGSAVVCSGDGATNNVAEWGGLVYGLIEVTGILAGRHLSWDHLEIRGDSDLVIKCLTEQWKTKKPHLKPWKEQALALLKGRSWNAQWIPREENQEADQLGRQAYPALPTPIR